MSTVIKPIISARDVNKYIGQPQTVLVDARGGADAYQRYRVGHLQGAVFMDLESDLSQKGPDAAIGGRHPLPTLLAFGNLLERSGINPASHVIVYDDKSGANAAARFWWMMKAVGHVKIQVIDGGLAALTGAGLPVVTGTDAPAALQTVYPIREWKLPLADLEMVDRARSAADYLVIDVRESYRYRGESEPIDLVAGHIPGAVNIPYIDNLEADGRFRSPEVLAAQFEEHIGNREGNKIIVHCGSGVTACHTLLAMEIAGLNSARLYVGSWSEWSRREKPIATGPNP